MELVLAIEQLYQTFSKLTKPTKIVNYGCVSCISKDDEKYFLQTPLKKLNDHIFGGIMESGNVIEMGNECYKYFIPRILELITIENYDFSFSFVEYIYRDFAKFDYKNTFNEKERRAVDNFFYSYLEQELAKPKVERDESEIFNIAETGFNAIPLLEKIQQRKDWGEIKKELNYHLYLQENKWVKSKAEFKIWSKKGTRKSIINYLSN
ncbi:hypothetical protein [uncultured Polaribacter sp.]|uniref:hypothetical protein n=1 Tax=uncultured Polaribacter sp. TaxID=174711 RepID=UPI00262309A4|nr:hypothetical protein [uncultured Polaribacter sp.]